MEINMNNNLKNEQEVVQPQNQIIFLNSEEIEKENDELFSYIKDYLIDQLLKIKKNNKLKNIVLEEILEQILAERKNYSKANKKINILELENKKLKKIKSHIQDSNKIYLAYEQKDDFEDKKSSDDVFYKILEDYESSKYLSFIELEFIEKLYENLKDLVSFYESNQKENIEEKMLNKIETPTNSNEINLLINQNEKNKDDGKTNTIIEYGTIDSKSKEIKKENEKYYEKIINNFSDRRKELKVDFEKTLNFVNIIDEIEYFKKIWDEKIILIESNSFRYGLLAKENEKLLDVYESLQPFLTILKDNKNQFYMNIEKYEEDESSDYAQEYKKIRKLYRKLINLRDFYAFSSEEKLEDLNTITFNKEEKTNKTNVDEKERKMQSVKVFKQRYTKEAIYEEIPKIIAEIEKKLGDVQQNAENIKYIVSINFLKSMLEKLKTYYDEINYVKTIKERNKFDLLFFDLFQKFEEILFELKDKPETIKQFAVVLDENNNEDVEEEEVYERDDVSSDSEENDKENEKAKKYLLDYYNKIKQILPKELGLFKEIIEVWVNIYYYSNPYRDCKKIIENLDKKLEKISDNMLKLNMRLNKFKSKLDLAIS